MSSVSSACFSRVHKYHATKHTLLLAIVASVGLTACSSQQSSKPVVEPSTSSAIKKPGGVLKSMLASDIAIIDIE
ncbi:MAG: hypothetical protein ACTH5M_09560, partial [Psychrobacter sp.]